MACTGTHGLDAVLYVSTDPVAPWRRPSHNLLAHDPDTDGSLEAKLKHLELIQGVINRLAGESARLKNWSVTLVAGLFALMGSTGQLDTFRLDAFMVTLMPIVVF